MRVLILEDAQERILDFRRQFFEHEVFITKEPKEAIEWLKEFEFDVITLDHDLSLKAQGTDNNFDVGTGLELAKFIGENPELSKDAQIFIHSLNYGGTSRMQNAMKSRGEVPHMPFLWMKEVEFN